jgi:hypothetical protein
MTDRVLCICGHAQDEHWRDRDGCKYSCACGSFRRASSNRATGRTMKGLCQNCGEPVLNFRDHWLADRSGYACHAIPNRAPWEGCERFDSAGGYCIEGKDCSCGWYQVYTEVPPPHATPNRVEWIVALDHALRVGEPSHEQLLSLGNLLAWLKDENDV